MPEKKTVEAAEEDRREGKLPGTQAGEFVREEMEHIREGKHGARSTKQAIAIGLSKARRAGVDLAPPKEGTTSEETAEKAERDVEKGRSGSRKTSARRSRATSAALARQAHEAAGRRTHAERAASARKAARTRSAHPRKRRRT